MLVLVVCVFVCIVCFALFLQLFAGCVWLVAVDLRVSGTGLIVGAAVGVVLHTSTGFCGCCLRC